jgi:exopolyphosphatase/guanosine-5'-triphosphate,3'-diphosphate pyrophosphatase
VDVGSNSIRLVVFDSVSPAPAYFFNEKASCGLGAEIADTGRLHPEGVERALRALGRFAQLARRMQVAHVDAVATAAVREAEDGPAFRARVQQETGLALRVVSGDEEARLSAQGALLGEPAAHGLVADMGGSSLELAVVGDNAVGPRLTLPLGPQRLQGLSAAAQRKRIDAALEEAAPALGPHGPNLYVVGGAWRSVAKAHMARAEYPLQVLQGFRLNAAAAAEACDWLSKADVAALKALPGVSSNRAPGTPLAAAILGRLIDRFAPEQVAVSAFGLREGLLFERLPLELRAEDPLLHACRLLERNQARFPGFGDELAAWTAPLTRDWTPALRRLAHAACLLNDVNWRAHPDYRAVGCFETVTRANLAGVDHAGRTFLGVALMQRYGGGRRTREVDAALKLLSERQDGAARMLGRAMRLGAMISGSTPGALADARLTVDGPLVSLDLMNGLRPLEGETVERRLRALADLVAAEAARQA